MSVRSASLLQRMDDIPAATAHLEDRHSVRRDCWPAVCVLGPILITVRDISSPAAYFLETGVPRGNTPCLRTQLSCFWFSRPATVCAPGYLLGGGAPLGRLVDPEPSAANVKCPQAGAGQPASRLTLSANLGGGTCRRLRDRVYPSSAFAPFAAPFARDRDELAKCGRAKCSPRQYPARKPKKIRLFPSSPSLWCAAPQRLTAHRGSGTFANQEHFVTRCGTK